MAMSRQVIKTDEISMKIPEKIPVVSGNAPRNAVIYPTTECERVFQTKMYVFYS